MKKTLLAVAVGGQCPLAIGLPARLAAEALDPITLVMTRKMLLGIKERAERSHRAVAA